MRLGFDRGIEGPGERIVLGIRARQLAWVSGAVAAALAVVPVGAAFAVGGGGSARVSAAADDPDSTVEDYRYPDADKILNDFKVKLISGDGHIVFADCAKSPASGDIGFIKVRTTEEI